MAVGEITVQALAEDLKESVPYVLLDVRDPNELEISRLDGITHIPMDEVMARLDELDGNLPTVVICRTGNRSARVAQALSDAGFADVRNLLGGMNAWATEIDPSMETY